MQQQPRFTPRYALTFGEVAILHVGGKEFGDGIRECGFAVDELRAVAAKLNGRDPGRAEVVLISDRLPTAAMRSEHEAAVLVVRNGAEIFCSANTAGTGGGAYCAGNAADELIQEQRKIRYDRKFWNARQRKTMNKRARYNTCFGETSISPSEDFSQPTVHAFPPRLAAFRTGCAAVLGPKAQGLGAEGNHYFEPRSGIGFHGDSERKIVICLSLGGSSTLRYQWRFPGSSEHTLPPTDVRVGHGDVYVMSEKATGFDWRFRSRIRVVHGAGAEKYIGTKKKKKQQPTRGKGKRAAATAMQRSDAESEGTEAPTSAKRAKVVSES